MFENFLYVCAAGVFTTASLIAITVKDNRNFAKEELKEVNHIVNVLKLKNQGKNVFSADAQTARALQFVHCTNTDEKLERWRNEKVAEKQQYLQRPFYKQLSAPPIACFVDLFYDLDRLK